MDDIFAITGGNMTSQFKPLYDFCKQVERDHPGHAIDKIAGHSLGAHLAVCLAPAYPDAKIYAFDCPGLTHGLEHHLGRFYGKSEAQIRDFYRDHAKNMLQVDNGRNSFNSLGWMPREVSMVDPAKDPYSAAPVKSLFPAGHLYGGRVLQRNPETRPRDQSRPAKTVQHGA